LPENEEKKKYLNGYIYSQRKIKLLAEQIDELRSNKMFPSVNNDGMPRASGINDLSGYAGKLDELIRQLEVEQDLAIQKRKEIRSQIQSMADETEKEILERRYLLGETWERIAVDMNYNYRWVLRLHGRALRNFKIS
jgi:hypothetical protein